MGLLSYVLCGFMAHVVSYWGYCLIPHVVLQGKLSYRECHLMGLLSYLSCFHTGHVITGDVASWGVKPCGACHLRVQMIQGSSFRLGQLSFQIWGRIPNGLNVKSHIYINAIAVMGWFKKNQWNFPLSLLGGSSMTQFSIKKIYMVFKHFILPEKHFKANLFFPIMPPAP